MYCIALLAEMFPVIPVERNMNNFPSGLFYYIDDIVELNLVEYQQVNIY